MGKDMSNLFEGRKYYWIVFDFPQKQWEWAELFGKNHAVHKHRGNLEDFEIRLIAIDFIMMIFILNRRWFPEIT